MPSIRNRGVQYEQSAVIPYRTDRRTLQVMLVTSRSGKRWVIPKGLCETGMTAAESAAKEAYEEAGIEGVVDNRSIGSYEYSKWGGVCRVKVYLMHVDTELDDWPEACLRQRKWLSFAAAADRVLEKKLMNWLRRLPELVEASADA